MRIPKPVQPQSALLLINAWPQPTQEMVDLPRFFNKPVIISGTTTNKSEVLAAAALSNQMIYFGHAVRQGRAVALKLNDDILLEAADFLPLKKSQFFPDSVGGLLYSDWRPVRFAGQQCPGPFLSGCRGSSCSGKSMGCL